jgi:hypothetical protein
VKKTFISAIVATAAFAFGSTALAQGGKPIMSGSGGPNGNYFGMMNDINSEHYCKAATARPIEVVNTDGSVENLLGMGSKKFTMGPVQEDVLQFFAKKDPKRVNKNRLKILMGLHTETVHLLIPKSFQPSQAQKDLGWGSTFSDWFGGANKNTAPPKIEVGMLKNQIVGSWGGSMVSAKALSYFMDLNLDVKELKEKDRVNPSMPLLLVGGQPYKVVEDYLATGKYHLVGLDFAQIQNRAPFYMETTANYRINGRLASIPTVGVRALLIGKSFRKEERNQDMLMLSKCISDNLADLADDADTNANWGSVYELEESGEQTNWSYFKL